MPGKSSRVVLIEPNHGRRYAPLRGANSYRVAFEQFGGGDLTVDPSMSDGIRHPIRQ